MIKNYVDNAFAQVPENEEIRMLKEEMITNMEEKYDDLIQAGSSHHEALGEVITEFGNVDEILKELELDISDEENINVYGSEEIQAFQDRRSSLNRGMSAGIALIIMSLSLPSLMKYLHLKYEWLVESIAPVSLFLVMGIGATIIIYNVVNMNEDFNFSPPFLVSYDLKKDLAGAFKENRQVFRRKLSLGIFFCVLSFIGPILGRDPSLNSGLFEALSIFFMFALMGIGVYFIVTASLDRMLLKHLNEYAITKIDWYHNKERLQAKYEQKRRKKEFEEEFSNYSWILWVLATAIYIKWSFSSGGWVYTWVVFLIASALVQLLEFLLKRFR